MLCYHNCLFNFWFNVPVNNFSVILGLSHRILGIDKLTCIYQEQNLTPVGLNPSLKVIKTISSSAQLSMKFQLLINVEIVKIIEQDTFQSQLS